MLSVKGNKIIDTSGNPVRLRGTCVGGWMNMENFINGFPGTEMGVRSQLTEVLGNKKAHFLLDRMRHYFFHENDILFLKECGANTVRLPLNYRHFESDMEPFRYLESGFEKLDEIIALCEKNGVYVILDMHAVQGWQNAHWHSDNPRGISLFWDNIQYQDRFVALWEEFARRYAGNAAVAGYNLMNEPCTNTSYGDYPHNFFDQYVPRWDRINAVYRRVVKAIREIDPDHILFLEGDCYSRYFSGLEDPFDDNLVYSSHNYISAGFGPGVYPGIFSTHRADRQFENGYWDRAKQVEILKRHDGVQFAQKHNVPLWSGEFGAQYNGPAEEYSSRLLAMDDQLDVFEEFGTHWTTWTYKDVGVMGWVMLDPESEYMQRIASVQKKKGLLGAENFTGRFVQSPAKKAVKELAALMEGIIEDEALNPLSNNTCLGEAALTQYAAGLLEPVYAKCFRGLTEEQIDSIMQSFAFSRCKINTGLVEVLKKHLSRPV